MVEVTASLVKKLHARAHLVARLLLCAIAVTAFLIINTAQSFAEESRRVALVVGNTGYQNVGILRNAVRDARSVADTLERIGFEVFLLEDAQAGEIEAAIEEVQERAEGADATLFYFSGHGFQMGGVNYLVPVDAKMRDRAKIEDETLRLDAVISSLQQRGRQTLIFLDACRNDPLPASVRSRTSGQGLAQVQTGDGTFVAFATQPGNVTADGVGDNSPFTQAFLNHVETPNISVSDLMIRVRNTVESKTLGRQTPWDQSSLREQFFFNPVEEEEPLLSQEDLDLLMSLDNLQLRAKFAEKLGVEMAEDGTIIIPEPEAEEQEVALAKPSGPRMTFGAPSAKPQEEVAEKPKAPRLTFGNSPQPGTDGDLPPLADGEQVETAESTVPNFRPGAPVAAPEEPATEVAALDPSVLGTPSRVTGVTEDAPVAVEATPEVPTQTATGQSAPSDEERVVVASRSETSDAGRITGRISATSVAPSQSDERVIGQEVDPAELAAASADGTKPVDPAAVPVAPRTGGDAVAQEETQLAALQPLSQDGNRRQVVSAYRSIGPVGGDSVATRSTISGYTVLRSLTPALPRVIGQDVTEEKEEPPVQVAALNPSATDAEPETKEAKPDSLAVETPDVPVEEPENLPLAVQTELQRLGCYTSSLDGIWGRGSERAVTRFYLNKLEDFDSSDPTFDLYKRLKLEEGVVCQPVVAKATPESVKPSTKRRAPAARTTRAKPQSKRPASRRKANRPKRNRAKPAARRSAPKRTARKKSGGGKIKKLGKLRGVWR